jgi:hypothetical protein
MLWGANLWCPAPCRDGQLEEYFSVALGTFLHLVRYEAAPRYVGRKPMMFWAAVTALATGAFAFVGDMSSTLVGLAEVAGVIALFALICAAEAFSVPKN